jgi:hypothetical protein
MLIWPRVVCETTVCRLAHLWSESSQAVWAQATGGSTGALLVSPFNVKWGFYAWAGGVEESVLPVLGGFSCKVYLLCLSKILL